MTSTKKNLLITGATGLIGSQLSKRLIQEGWALTVLGRRTEDKFRSEFSLPCRYFQWSHPTVNPPPREAMDVNAAIHLMGESIAKSRWTRELKQELKDSRIDTTALLVASLKNQPNLETFICASAIGIYGDRGDETLTEASSLDGGFLGALCKEWESEARKIPCRSVQIRTGIVLSTRGGALSTIAPLFKKRLGGHLGNGQQWMSWIHIDDLVEIYVRALTDSSLKGPVNAVAPNPERNKDFTQDLAQALHVKALLPAPRTHWK